MPSSHDIYLLGPNPSDLSLFRRKDENNKPKSGKSSLFHKKSTHERDSYRKQFINTTLPPKHANVPSGKRKKREEKKKEKTIYSIGKHCKLRPCPWKTRKWSVVFFGNFISFSSFFPSEMDQIYAKRAILKRTSAQLKVDVKLAGIGRNWVRVGGFFGTFWRKKTFSGKKIFLIEYLIEILKIWKKNFFLFLKFFFLNSPNCFQYAARQKTVDIGNGAIPMFTSKTISVQPTASDYEQPSSQLITTATTPEKHYGSIHFRVEYDFEQSKVLKGFMRKKRKLKINF